MTGLQPCIGDWTCEQGSVSGSDFSALRLVHRSAVSRTSQQEKLSSCTIPYKSFNVEEVGH